MHKYIVHFCIKKKGVSDINHELTFSKPVGRGEIIHYTPVIKSKEQYWFIDDVVHVVTMSSREERDTILVVSPANLPVKIPS